MVQPRNQPPDVSLGPVKRFDRFTLIKKLATGGMAEIWLARMSGLAGFNRFVVIKKILSHLAEEETFVKMFLDEARMSSALSHPNIVQVYDLGEAAGTYFIAMEYIAGENLAAMAWRGVKRRKPFAPQLAARVIADACKALHYAHHLKGSDGAPLQLVHRDVSPQNILVTYEGDVKVVDFGIAKAATKSQHTKTGMLKGKFSYMSPEQCLGHPVDMRSDIFALGIVLYELCTGKRLFKHESELMILEMITRRRITPPSDVARDIAPELENIILTALQKETRDRFQTGQDMQIALEDYLRNESKPSSNSDVSSYMRDLFADKMEEKRKLIELASQDDFLDNYSSEEVTGEMAPHGTKRRVVYGRASDVRVQGMTPRGAMVPGMTPSSMPGGVPLQTGGSLPPGISASQLAALQQSGHIYTEESAWGPRIIIILALLAIVGALTFLFVEVDPFGEPPELTPSPVPAEVGWVVIDSIPDGAEIWVDGKPIKLGKGQETARTPIEQLSGLEFGRNYELRLIKDGYETFSQTIPMGPETNEQKITATLKPIPAKVIVQVRGGLSPRIEFNGKDVGTGPEIIREVNPGPLMVVATLSKHSCRTDPVRLDVLPGKAGRVNITCTRKKRPPSGRSKSTVAAPPPPPPPTRRRARGGCQPDPSAPPGFVTIVTKPYSTIYYGKKKLGDTPINKKKLPAGCVELTAVHPGPPERRKKVEVKVEPNEVKRYRFNL